MLLRLVFSVVWLFLGKVLCQTGPPSPSPTSPPSTPPLPTMVYKVSTFVGWTLGANNLPGTNAWLNMPAGMVSDGQGNVYVADMMNHKIRKITPVGMVSTYVGVGGTGLFSDGFSTASYFNFPRGLAFDPTGNLVVADSANNRIRSISKATQEVSTRAGNGVTASVNGPGLNASFSNPYDVAVDASNNIFVSDYGNNCIRIISPANFVSTFAGRCGSTSGSLVNDGPSTYATFYGPTGIQFSPAGELWIGDYLSYRIRKISSGMVFTVAGSTGGYEDGSATQAKLSARDFAFDGSGNVYFTDFGNYRIRMFSQATNQVSTVAGSTAYAMVDDYGTQASFYYPYGVITANATTLFVSDHMNHRIRAISIISCMLGGFFDYNLKSCVCPPGYGYDANLNTCTICAAGTYQPNLSASPCQLCPTGTTNNQGATTCTPTKSVSNTICSVGNFYNGYSCQQCAPGQYQNATGQTSCLYCDPGKYQNAAGQTFCRACDPGSYQNLSGQTLCNPCDSGTYQNAGGSTNCINCPAGKFQGQTGMLSCFNCGPGTFSSTEKQITCQTCLDGMFQDQYGATYCNSCALGFTSNATKTGCVLASQASFSLTSVCSNTDNIKIYSSASFLVTQCNNLISVWDAVAASRLQTLPSFTSTISTVSISYTYFVVGFFNQTTIQLYKRSQSDNIFRELNTTMNHGGDPSLSSSSMKSVTCLQIIDDKYLVTGGSDGLVNIWKLTDPAPVKIKNLTSFSETDTFCTGRNDILYIWSALSTNVIRYNVTIAEPVSFALTNSQTVKSLAFDIDHKYLAVQGSGNVLVVFDQTNPASVFQGSSYNIPGIEITSDRTLFGLNTASNSIQQGFYNTISGAFELKKSFPLTQSAKDVKFTEGTVYILGTDKVVRRYLLTDYMDYNPPAIVSTSPAFLGTLGGENLTIRFDSNHRNLSSSLQVSSVNVGGRACVNVVNVNVLEIVCVSPKNINAFKKLQVQLNAASIPSSFMVGHRSPKILSVSPNNSPTAGNVIVTLAVQNIGISGEDFPVITLKAGGAYYSCTAVQQLNDTSVKCKVPSTAYPGPASVRIQVGDQFYENAADENLFRYQNPEVVSVAPSVNLDLAGNELITITGNNFGVCQGCLSPQLAVTIGGRSCSNVIRINDTIITCRTPSYFGGNLPIVVTVESFSSVPVNLLSYKPPQVLNIDPRQSKVRTNFNITGLNFGFENNNASVVFTPISTAGAPSRLSAMVNWISNTWIGCSLPQQGLEPNVTYSIGILVQSQLSIQTNVTFLNLNANIAPIANASYVETMEMTQTVVRLTVSDPNPGDVLRVYIQKLPSIGDLYQYLGASTIGPKIDAVDTQLTDAGSRLYYQPRGVNNGLDNFKFYALDQDSYQSDVVTVSIYVIDVNQPPKEVENQKLTIFDPDEWTYIPLSGDDPDNTTLWYSLTELPLKGTLRDVANNVNITAVPYSFGNAVAKVNVSYLPEPYTYGDNYAFFKFTYSDRDNMTGIQLSPVSVSFDVRFKNHAPIILDGGSTTTPETVPVPCQFSSLYVDRDTNPNQILSVYVKSLPSKGTLFQVDSAGGHTLALTSGNLMVTSPMKQLLYVPTGYKNGYDSFEWYAADNFQNGQSTTAKFNIYIRPVNQSPVLEKFSVYETIRNSVDTTSITLPVKDFDEDGNFTIYALGVPPNRGLWYDKQGRLINFASRSFLYRVTAEPPNDIVLKVKHDGKGGAYPYATARFMVVDSLGANSTDSVYVELKVSCPPDTYNNVWYDPANNPTTSDVCAPCMKGGVCSNIGDKPPHNAAGFYPLDVTTFVGCSPESACPENVNTNGCAAGYTGVRCGQCAQEYYRLSGGCNKCPSLDFLKQPALIAIIAIVALIFLLGMVNLIQKIDLGFMSILITYLQTISLFRSLKLSWPFLVNEMFRLMSAVNFNIELTSPECFIAQDNSKTYEYKFFTTLGLPVALAFVVGMLIAVYSGVSAVTSSFGAGAQMDIDRWLQSRKQMKPMSEKDKWKVDTMRSDEMLYLEDGRNQSMPASFLNLYLMALKLMYLSLSTKALELFDCSYDPAEKFFFQIEPNRSCFIGGWWWDLLPFSVGAIIFYVIGIPSLVAYMAILRVRYLKIRPVQRTWKQNFLLQVTYKAKKEYRPECDYWESVISVRKLCIVASQLFFSEYAAFQAVLIILIFQVALLFQSHTTPYSIRSLNFLESATLFSSTLVLTGGILSHVSEFSDNQKEALGYLVVLIVIISAILVMGMLMFHLREVYRLKNRKINIEKPKVEEETKVHQLSVSKVKDFDVEKTSKTTTAAPTYIAGRRATIVRPGGNSIRQTSTLDAGFE